MRPGLVALLVFGIVACTGCDSITRANPSPTPVPSLTAARVVSLLANNHLLVADVTTGAVLAELTLGEPPALPSQIRAMAMSRDGHTLYALVRASGGARIALLDTTTLKLTTSIDLGGDLDYRGLAIGPRTGRLYLSANQRGDALVRVIDPSGAQPAQTWPARKSEGRDWYVYQGSVAPDETALYLSYHGPDTTGIDRFEIQPAGLLRCSIATRPDSGCFVTHGSFALAGGDLVASMGESPVASLDPVTGVRRDQYDLLLEGNHMLEFTIASGGLYAVGSCGYTGGLARADLSTGQTSVLAASRTRGGVCGERIAVSSDGSVLVVAKTAMSAPGNTPGALIVLSPDGKSLRTISTSAEPADLLLF
jgi:DNA-binding beta-propeller fold protein YncE